ncbi:ribosome-recycling factor [Buchnera aphidicola]|uniref:Ribosome recycling factor n=1 Tax=Buchnera aphidicola (Sarucallis kahawaluokalani) TaxID=1241878 RepID=A0A4D6Y9B2_9GAMM|nr:ribosome recycling factor [Buchnera aphidicola]QCI25959.1 ribosome recycling factor [Buchnera aphidicola (Sarucallis kahawaluokalani)]
MDYDILKDIEMRMKKCLLIFKKNISNVCIDRVSPKLLDKVYIEYYGKKTSLREISNITIESANILKINVFDKNILRVIEKEIFNSKIEATTVVQDGFIKLIFPSLTEERRKKIYKSIQVDAECNRIMMRNIRRDANDILKKHVKKKIFTLDDERMIQTEIQFLTNKYINIVNDLCLKKQSDIMRVGKH